MAGGLSTNGESAVLTALMTGRYISLHTGDPGNTGANEVAGSAYARQAQGSFSQTGNNPRTASNDATIDFPIATGSWGTISYFGIWDAVSAGNFLGGYALSVSKAIATDDIARFPATTLAITAD